MAEREKEPPWLSAAVDQRIAFMRDKMGELGWAMIRKQLALLMTPLTEPDEGSSPEEIARWERTCDNCGAFVPDGELFYTGQLVREFHGEQVILIFGVCPVCKEAP